MKTMSKKLGAIILALALCFSLCCTALAADGDTYSITISNATSGTSYTVIKIFDATYSDDGSAVAYSINSSTNSAIYAAINTEDSIFKLTPTNTENVYTVTLKDSVTTDTEIIAYLKTIITVDDHGNVTSPSGTSGITQSAEGSTLTITLDEPGYYFVTSALGSVVTITSATPTATVMDKNTPPGNLKKVIHDTTDGDVKSETEGGEDDVEFVVTADVPLYAPYDETVSENEETLEGYLVYDYEFDDTMTAGIDIEGLTVQDKNSTTAGYYIDGDKYYANNALINQWIHLTDKGTGTTYYLVDGTVDGVSVEGVAYNVVLELTHTDKEGNTLADGCFSGFTLTYDTVDIAGTDWDNIHNATEVQTKYPVNAGITIDYHAHVTNEAVYDNENDITMSWDMIPFSTLPTPDPENPKYTGEGKDHDDVYVWELDILKIDSDGTTGPLSGAVFELSGENLHDVVISTKEYYDPITSKEDYEKALEAGEVLFFKLVDGSYTTTSPYDLTDQEELAKYVKTENAEEGYEYTAYRHTVDTTTEFTEAEDEKVIGTTGENGELSFKGLKAGTYTLKEITAPDGYNLLPDNITIEITYDLEKNAFEVTVSNSTTGSTTGSVDYVDGVISLTIDNSQGTVLPGTGGIGTTIFYIIGGVIVVGAVVVLVTRRRMTREG